MKQTVVVSKFFPNTSNGAAAQEKADGKQLTPKENKKLKINLVEEVKRQRFFDRAKGVSTMEPISMRAISEPSTGAATQEREDWSHLTAQEKCQMQMAKEWFDNERAELLKQVKQHLADEAPVAMVAQVCHGGLDCHVRGL